MSQPPEDSRWQVYPPQPTGAPPGSEPAVQREPGTPAWLPAVPQTGGLPAASGVPAGPPAVPGRPGYSPHDPLLLSAGGSTIRKEGVWTVPPYLSLHGDFGTVRLDFRRARLSSRVTWIQVSGGAGTLVLVVPHGWAAQVDRVTPGIGTKKSRVAEEPTGDNPVLVLTGSLGMGTLKIRYPNRWDERRLRRQLRREGQPLQ